MKDKFKKYSAEEYRNLGGSFNPCAICTRRELNVDCGDCQGGYFVPVKAKPRPGKYERLLKALLKNGIIGTDGVLTVVLTDSERRELEKIREDMK